MVFLIHLLEDPCETTNVAEDFPNIVNKLEKKFAWFWKQLKSQKVLFIDPRANPIYYTIIIVGIRDGYR